jgi:CheY-like chemotaxis protein
MDRPLALVVDDEASIRQLFAVALRKLCDVVQAESGKAAMRELDGRRFDVVLLDLHMPEVDGFMVLEHLAARSGVNRDTPVFVLTADPSDEARSRAVRSRGALFLSKPVPVSVLVSLVSSTLDRRSKQAP